MNLIKEPLKTNWDKSFLILAFIISWFILIQAGPAHAKGFIDYHGTGGFYGQSNWTNIGPAPLDDYNWSHINYYIGKNLRPWVSVETSLGPGYIKTENFNDTGTIEWRLLLDMHKHFFYVKVGTGISYLFDSEGMPDLSDANFFSIISCSLGFRFRLDKNDSTSPQILAGYSVEHISDAFKGGDDGDNGLNAGAFNVQISWVF
jgi:hypothetical protein